jgi:hypothetical protein
LAAWFLRGFPKRNREAKYLIYKELVVMVHNPLSPLVFSKTQLKPSKSYDLEGFLFVLLSKINRITQLKGVLLGAHV